MKLMVVEYRVTYLDPCAAHEPGLITSDLRDLNDFPESLWKNIVKIERDVMDERGFVSTHTFVNLDAKR